MSSLKGSNKKYDETKYDRFCVIITKTENIDNSMPKCGIVGDLIFFHSVSNSYWYFIQTNNIAIFKWLYKEYICQTY